MWLLVLRNNKYLCTKLKLWQQLQYSHFSKKIDKYNKVFRPVCKQDVKIHFTAEDISSKVENRPGVYVIASPKTKFIYPKGKSSVIYIEESTHLKTRLTTHLRKFYNVTDSDNEEEILKTHGSSFQRYQYIKYHGGNNVSIYFFYCRGNQSSKNLEANIIARFF